MCRVLSSEVLQWLSTTSVSAEKISIILAEKLKTDQELVIGNTSKDS